MRVQFLILKWVAFWFYPNVDLADKALVELFDKIDLWSSTKGQLWVITHLKEIRLLYTRFLSGNPVRVSSHIIGIRKDGLPKGFPILNEIFLKGNRESISFTLTLLSVSRTIKVWKPVSTETITAPYKGTVTDFSIFRKDIVKVLRTFGVKGFALNWSRSDLHYSTKAGPNGLSTYSAPIDSIFLTDQQIQMIRILSPELADYASLFRFMNVKDLFPFFRKSEKAVPINATRKLSVVKDPEGKSRVIAIFDYYSQTLLRLIHDECFNILRVFECDRTFTQNPHVNFEGPYYSFDLSAATDRFPLAFQKEIVNYLLSDRAKANAWASLLSDTEFYVPWEDKFVKYEVGQPMGAYSSWAVFALSHHVAVQLSAIKCGQFPTRNYILLGDDIVIGGEKLANAYLSLMASLGVDISFHKTHVSSNTYEFAKRWFHKGIEVSPIQVNAFMETWKNYTLFFNTLKSYMERGFVPYAFTPISEVMYSLMVTLGMYPRKAENLCRKVPILNALYRWIRNGDDELIRSVLVQNHHGEAMVPQPGSPFLRDFILMRMMIPFEKMYSNLEKDMMNYIDNLDKTLIDHFEKGWNKQLQLDNGGFNLDALDSMGLEPDFIGPGDVANLPVSIAIRNAFAKLAADPDISNPEKDWQKAVKALCVPSPFVRGVRSDDQIKLVTAKLASKLLETHKVLFRDNGPGWMFEAQWFSRSQDRRLGQ